MGVNKTYFWMKLKENFFKQREIKKLRRIAGGDTFTIIYLKMQLLAMKNEGWIYFEETEQNIYEQLEYELDEDIENIKVTVSFLAKHNLLELNEDQDCYLSEVIECTGKETASTLRSRKSRERKKKIEALQCNTKPLQINTVATKCNTELEKEIEIDIDKDKDIKLCKQSSPQNIFKFYNTNIGLITQFVAQEIESYLDDGIEEQMIIKCLKVALEQNVPKWGYAKAIIENKTKQGIKTLDDFEASEIQHKQKDTAPEPTEEFVLTDEMLNGSIFDIK